MPDFLPYNTPVDSDYRKLHDEEVLSLTISMAVEQAQDGYLAAQIPAALTCPNYGDELKQALSHARRGIGPGQRHFA